MSTILITKIASLLTIAFFTIAERKLLASIQRRKGPNATRFWNTHQAFADGLKLLLKGVIMPVRSNWVLFLLAPCLSLAIAQFTRVYTLFLDSPYPAGFIIALAALFFLYRGEFKYDAAETPNAKFSTSGAISALVGGRIAARLKPRKEPMGIRFMVRLGAKAAAAARATRVTTKVGAGVKPAFNAYGASKFAKASAKAAAAGTAAKTAARIATLKQIGTGVGIYVAWNSADYLKNKALGGSTEEYKTNIHVEEHISSVTNHYHTTYQAPSVISRQLPTSAAESTITPSVPVPSGAAPTAPVLPKGDGTFTPGSGDVWMGSPLEIFEGPILLSGMPMLWFSIVYSVMFALICMYTLSPGLSLITRTTTAAYRVKLTITAEQMEKAKFWIFTYNVGTAAYLFNRYLVELLIFEKPDTGVETIDFYIDHLAVLANYPLFWMVSGIPTILLILLVCKFLRSLWFVWCEKVGLTGLRAFLLLCLVFISLSCLQVVSLYMFYTAPGVNQALFARLLELACLEINPVQPDSLPAWFNLENIIADLELKREKALWTVGAFIEAWHQKAHLLMSNDDYLKIIFRRCETIFVLLSFFSFTDWVQLFIYQLYPLTAWGIFYDINEGAICGEDGLTYKAFIRRGAYLLFKLLIFEYDLSLLEKESLAEFLIFIIPTISGPAENWISF